MAIIDLEVFLYPFKGDSLEQTFVFRHSLDANFLKAIISIKKLIEPSFSKNKITIDSIRKIITKQDFCLVDDKYKYDIDEFTKKFPQSIQAVELIERHTQVFFQKHLGGHLKSISDKISAFIKSQSSLQLKDARDFMCHSLEQRPKEMLSVEFFDNLVKTINELLFLLSYLYKFVFDKKADFFNTAAKIASDLAKDYWETINAGSKVGKDRKVQMETLMAALRGDAV
jgi:hypothetical protein